MITASGAPHASACEGIRDLLIIVEGTDCSGKSAIVRQLSDVLRTVFVGDDVEVRHSKKPKLNTHPLDEYERPLFSYRPGMGHHIIFDRHFVGEWVYPTVLSRPSRANHATWQHITGFLASRGAIIVHVDASDEWVDRCVRERGDDLVTPAQAVSAARLFREVLASLDKIRLGDERGPLLISEVISAAREAEGRARVLNDVVTYVGPPRPKYLLVGDVRHAHRHDVTAVAARADLSPAFMPYTGTSGHFLLTHLSGQLSSSYGLVNGRDVDDLRLVYDALSEPRVIPLGGNARRAVTHALPDIIAPHVPHPQYVKRFLHAHGAHYGAYIEYVATRSSFDDDITFDEWIDSTYRRSSVRSHV
jgi:hypothetical protein